eukprot:Seg11662.1 transcript_id=Seg11662.1/GoldUCD/mRNA.D3Y31 product="hypothetical protein" protein_id=Seg11662.1/GoldUCD/D3Y31
MPRRARRTLTGNRERQRRREREALLRQPVLHNEQQDAERPEREAILERRVQENAQRAAERRFHNVQQQRQQGNAQQRLPQNPLPHQLPERHSLGAMDNTCPKCSAKFFSQEKTTRNVFTKCCNQGKTVLPALRQPSDEVISAFR